MNWLSRASALAHRFGETVTTELRESSQSRAKA
jgi:hypothetical protein